MRLVRQPEHTRADAAAVAERLWRAATRVLLLCVVFGVAPAGPHQQSQCPHQTAPCGIPGLAFAPPAPPAPQSAPVATQPHAADKPPAQKPRPAGKLPAREPRAAEELPSHKLRAADNDRMQYFLIGPAASTKTPPDGFRLLLVLPGGDGSADFHPFIKRIAANALDARYLVAQLVAPQWSPDQHKRVVWPSRRLTLEGAQFVTEDFIRAVVADVKQRHEIDERHIFALGWSSGGPPVYASGVDPHSPLRGLFVAMSVFKPEGLGDLAAVRGKAVYILHSPQDFIPIRMAESARDLLAKAGATTTLVTYEGGHGWHGDVYGHLRRGVRWLEQESAARPAATTRAAE